MRSGLPRAALPVRRGETKTDFACRAPPKHRSNLLEHARSSSSRVHPTADFGFTNEQMAEQGAQQGRMQSSDGISSGRGRSEPAGTLLARVAKGIDKILAPGRSVFPGTCTHGPRRTKLGLVISSVKGQG